MNKRYKFKEDILFSQSISHYPYEEGAAKLYAAFMKNNPQLEGEEIHCRVDKKEQEEDYYGNGGGVDYTLKIFRLVKETDQEYEARQKALEDDIVNKFRDGIFFPTRNLRSDCLDVDNFENVRKKVKEVFERELEETFKNFH